MTNNSLFHNRKIAAPDTFAKVEPLDFPMARHRLVTLHEESRRRNLCSTTYAHHFDNKSMGESEPLIQELLDWVSKPEGKLTVKDENNGDLVM